MCLYSVYDLYVVCIQNMSRSYVIRRYLVHIEGAMCVVSGDVV